MPQLTPPYHIPGQDSTFATLLRVAGFLGETPVGLGITGSVSLIV
jgi:hypothetical protein